jgi:thiol-disulfide isomerase/thioredoxin
MNIKYRTLVAPSIASKGDAFRLEVIDILADPENWAKYGVNFIYSDDADTLPIRLTPVEEIDSSMQGFSYYTPSDTITGKPAIYINEGNWEGGSKSKLPLHDYRRYVILHETGHHLQSLVLPWGHSPHPQKDNECVGCVAPIMMQMTMGPEFISPYIENSRPTGKTLKEALTGGKMEQMNVVVVVAIVILTLMVLCMCGGRDTRGGDSGAVTVLYYADWCGPCQAFIPVWIALKQELGDQYPMMEMESSDIPSHVDIQGFPTIRKYSVNGEVDFRGVRTFDSVRRFIERD